MMRVLVIAATAVLVLAACSQQAPVTPDAEAPAAEASGIDPVIEALVRAAVPSIEITGGVLDDSDGEYEVAGLTPDGEAVEVDLVRANNVWTIAEIQRDVEWANVPETVRAAAAADPNGFEPARVIESTQPVDGVTVYELFKPGTPPGQSDLEVRWYEGEAAVMPPAH